MKNKKEKQKNTLLLLWEVMTKKDKIKFFLLMLLGLVSAVAVLIPTQILSVIISILSGTQAKFFGILIPNTWSYIVVIFGGGVITYFMRILSTTYDLRMEALIKRVVANLRSRTYSWLISPRKNMDLKMTQGDVLYRMNEAPASIEQF